MRERRNFRPIPRAAQGGFSLIPHPDHLLTALPAIYRQLVGG